MPQTLAAEDAIRISLRGGAKRLCELQAALEDRGISKNTLLRALKNVAVKADGRWGLPASRQ